MSTLKKGYYIIIEGGVGAGKDTNLANLEKLYKLIYPNKNIYFTREPGGTEVALELRKIAQSTMYADKLDKITELFLYVTARASLIEKEVAPRINNGEVVISNRGFPSSLVNQGFAQNIGISKVLSLHKLIFNMCFPDKVLYYKLDPMIGLERVKKSYNEDDKRLSDDKHELKKSKYHKDIFIGYEKISKLPILSPIWNEIDASKSKEDVFTDTINLFSLIMDKKFGKPDLSKLNESNEFYKYFY